tara:strand:- start:268 stop:1134 length:867 start_codon:yes stop_codon:yes gene_type:complete
LKILKTKIALRQWASANDCHAPSHSIGFVPTMGALHEGHLSLIRTSKKECQKTIVSVFVNKLQFSPNEDFNTYPRFIEKDIQQLENEEVDVLFCPDTEELCPDDLSFQINETKIAHELEGASRSHFFSGVCLIVLKLFNIVQPSRVYFGEKDIQQLYVIQKMIKDFNMSIQLIGCPTVREKNGLAMSSRNQYLSTNEKEEAAILYQALTSGRKEILEGERDVKSIINMISEKIANKNIRIDYLEIRDLATFDKIKDDILKPTWYKQPIVIVAAVYYKKVRLIDNVILK